MVSSTKKWKKIRQSWHYSWANAFSATWNQPIETLLSILAIAVSLTLPSVSYTIWKNSQQIVKQWHPIPQLTVYLDNYLPDKTAENIAQQLRIEENIALVTYLSRKEAEKEFRAWSGFASALDMLEENPLPAVITITPQLNFQTPQALARLRDHVNKIKHVAEVRIDDNGFIYLTTLSIFIANITVILSILMIFVILLVISSNVRLSILNYRKNIHVMKLIGATDAFIVRPFLHSGIMLGLMGAGLSLILSTLLIWSLKVIAMPVAKIFGDFAFIFYGLNLDECLLLLLFPAMIGWISAWFATLKQLRAFSPT